MQLLLCVCHCILCVHVSLFVLYVRKVFGFDWLAPDDYIVGTFTVNFGTAAGDVQCQSIDIILDSEMETSGESFLVDIDLPTTGPIQRGAPGQTRVLIIGKK